MRKVDWVDKKVIDRVKANGYIFGYLGGAIQESEDYGVNWRRVISLALSRPEINSTVYDPTVVEPAKFGVSMKGWDEKKKNFKMKKKFLEFYRTMGSVVHLDLYALNESHYSVFRLNKERTYGTTEEIVHFVLELKRPTFIFYDDEDGLAHFSDWILERLLEAQFEHYVCVKIFPTIKSIVSFVRKHREDIKRWDRNYRRTMKMIRGWRALCRELRWSQRRKVFPDVPAAIDAKLRETYLLIQEAKQDLRNCDSVEALEKTNRIRKQINSIRRTMKIRNNKKAS